MKKSNFHKLNRTEKSKDAVNDIMSGIIISDSKPLSNEDMILCQKWEYHIDGSSKTLNLLRECVKPGTVIKTSMKVDESINQITSEKIMEAVKKFYQFYYSVFQSKYLLQIRCLMKTVFLVAEVDLSQNCDIFSVRRKRRSSSCAGYF